MNPKRRIVIKGIALGGAVALTGGLLRPARAAWPEAAFEAESLDNALSALFDDATIEDSDAITLTAPEIAENGAVVPVSISTDLDRVESISLLVENNPAPLAASFELPPDMLPEVSTRIKMAETSNVIAVVRADGRLYKTQQEVKVTIGGCGG